MIALPSPHTEPPSGPMRPTIGRYLLRALLVLSLIYYAALVLDLILHPLAPGIGVDGLFEERILETLAGTGAIVLGAFIMRRVPGNRVGPLLIVYGVGAASYTTRVDFGSPLLTSIAHLLSDFFSGGVGSGVSSVVLVILLVSFPTGQVYPRRAARWIMLYVILLMIANILGIMAQSPGGGISCSGCDLPMNPFFVPSLSPFNSLLNGAINYILLVLGLVAAAVSLILRYRAAQTREQQQLKWFVWVTAVVGAGIIAFAVLPNVTTAMPGSPLVTAITAIFVTLLNTFLAIGIGISILRHRLWEIDIIINRTLVYGSLTALLALLYFGLVFALQSLFQGVFKQNNDVAIVVSTLAIAALFQPLRRRIQAIIDRRFYRRKYDAARTLAAFSATLRNEVDLRQLHEHLLAVVEETMQPTHVSLWLRPVGHDRKSNTNK